MLLTLLGGTVTQSSVLLPRAPASPSEARAASPSLRLKERQEPAAWSWLLCGSDRIYLLGPSECSPSGSEYNNGCFSQCKLRAQLCLCLPHKHENLDLNPQNPGKKLGKGPHPVLLLGDGRLRQENPQKLMGQLTWHTQQQTTKTLFSSNMEGNRHAKSSWPPSMDHEPW